MGIPSAAAIASESAGTFASVLAVGVRTMLSVKTAELRTTLRASMTPMPYLYATATCGSSDTIVKPGSLPSSMSAWICVTLSEPIVPKSSWLAIPAFDTALRASSTSAEVTPRAVARA